MKHLALATRYRPQRFDEVAGQDLIKAVLSRASAEDRVASGYLLSGTRGVGKTTIARIFAKALNCEKAPCAEPCNECSSCRRITAGAHPDVVEMDGASNNKVEDARALRETVGFAPMEGRYKIFIIDEAHMLTRNAFNALLKTLEEPPPRVVFIFATTEIFRFPATILSRCQVFSFRHLSEDTITAHLGKILTSEGMPYEDGALRLIARRAAGSARDSMSLLDQILAYGPDTLTADIARTVLGLAGLEATGSLLDALASGNCADAALFTKNLVSKEVDIGFFLRELTDTIRSLFLLRQNGREAVARLGVPENELNLLGAMAPKFSPAYLHAAWQMILQSQISVSSSQEPAAALELLLVNLALLPNLLPSGLIRQAQPAEPSAPAVPVQTRTETARPAPAVPDRSEDPAPAPAPAPEKSSKPAPQPKPEEARPAPERRPEPQVTAPEPAPAPKPAAPAPATKPAPEPAEPEPEAEPAPQPPGAPASQGSELTLPDMDAFMAWLQNQPARGISTYMLNGVRFTALKDGVVTVEGPGSTQLGTLIRGGKLADALSEFTGFRLRVEKAVSASSARPAPERSQSGYDRPELKHCFELLKAHVDGVQRIR